MLVANLIEKARHRYAQAIPMAVQKVDQQSKMDVGLLELVVREPRHTLRLPRRLGTIFPAMHPKKIISWRKRSSWVAVFDVLGFSNMMSEAEKDFPRALLTSKLNALIHSLNSNEKRHGKLEHLMFSDTLVLFGPTFESYAWFLVQCKNLIKDSIRLRLPLRGAISFGTTFSSSRQRMVIGRPFLDAYRYCEGQDWVGLLLTPTAIETLRQNGLEPLRHDFVTGPVPLKKELPPDGTLAYRFQNGQSSFSNPLIAWLEEMRQHAPESAKRKYTLTIEHIRRHQQQLRRER